MKKWIPIVAVLMAGCDGGGDEGTANGGSENEFAAPEIVITAEPARIDRANTPRLASIVLGSIEVGRGLYSLWRQGDFFELLETGSTKEQCSGGGSLSLDLNKARTKLVERYNSCRIRLDSGYYSISGRVLTEFSGIDASGEFKVRSIYRDYQLLADSGEEELLEATVEFNGDRSAGVDFHPSLKISLYAKNSIEGDIRVVDFRFDIADGEAFATNLESVLVSAGKIEYVNIGSVELLGRGRSHIEMTGSSEDVGLIDFIDSDVRLYFDAADGNARDAALRIPVRELGSVAFNRDIGASPELRSGSRPMAYLLDFTEGEVASLPSLQYFRHEGGQLLDVQLSIDHSAPQNASSEEEDTYVEPESWVEQTEVGSFRFGLTGQMQYNEVTFYLTAYATDTDGRVSPEPVEFPVTFFRDTDRDGEPDFKDWDDDNDGVNDSDDAFPKDRSETSDLDGDGIGDNKDTDDDADGVEDIADAYPQDPLCHISSDGNGERCLLWELKAPTWKKMLDRNGVVMYSGGYEGVIHRWDSTTRHFIDPIEPTPSVVGSFQSPYSVFYTPEQHALYMIYGGSGMSRIDLNTVPLMEVPFLSWDEMTGAVAISYSVHATQNFVVIAGRTARGLEYRSFNLNGQYLDTFQQDTNLETDRNYYRRVTVAPFCELGVALNPNTGLFEDLAGGNLDEGEIPEGAQENDRCFDMLDQHNVLPYVAPDGTRAIVADGSIVDLSGNEIGLNKVHLFPIGSLAWNKAGIFSFDRLEDSLLHYDNSGNLLQDIEFDQHVEMVLGNENHLVWYSGEIPMVVDLEVPISEP